MEPVALSPSLASKKPLHHGMTSGDAAKEFKTMLVAQVAENHARSRPDGRDTRTR
jgi:hypothetical protein